MPWGGEDFSVIIFLLAACSQTKPLFKNKFFINHEHEYVYLSRTCGAVSGKRDPKDFTATTKMEAAGSPKR